MAQKVRNPGAGRRQGFAVEMVSEAGLTCENSPLTIHRQGEIDVVAIIAARSGIAAATVRAHVDAFGLGGRQ